MLGEASPVITTGLSDLDRMLGGWPRGELTICAGRPAMGKSTLGVSTALRSAKGRSRRCYFSLEMTRKQVGARMIADMAYVQRDPVTYEAIGNRNVEGRHIERIKTAAEALSGLPLIAIRKSSAAIPCWRSLRAPKRLRRICSARGSASRHRHGGPHRLGASVQQIRRHASS